jgi:hypothetical protein
MASSSGDPDEVEPHPQYDMAARLDELFSVPVYRYPENPLMESWRELGERLLALGERHLIEGVDAATDFLQSKLDARRRRRERRAAKQRAARAAAAAAAAAGTAAKCTS